jgi:DNA ligase D-like protein (predicted polymerase)
VNAEPVVAGVRISHPERVVYAELGLSKLDIARDYERLGPWIVPHVRGRPLTLVHCPKGMAGPCTYMKHSKLWGPNVLRRVRIQEKTKVGGYMVADDFGGIVGIAQMGALEIHTWNSTTDNLEQPNRIVWDLDPGPEVTWTHVITAARTVREILRTLGLESWVKTTGGRGLHVVLPIVPHRDWSECLAFSRSVAEAIRGTAPALYTTAFAKRGREAKILIDYLRNNRTNTSIAAYSTRARPGRRSPCLSPGRIDAAASAGGLDGQDSAAKTCTAPRRPVVRLLGEQATHQRRGDSGGDAPLTLDAMLTATRRRKVDVFVCWRSTGLVGTCVTSLSFSRSLQTLGVAFISLNEGVEATKPAGRLQMAVLGAIAQFERERHRRARSRPVWRGPGRQKSASSAGLAPTRHHLPPRVCPWERPRHHGGLEEHGGQMDEGRPHGRLPRAS